MLLVLLAACGGAGDPAFGSGGERTDGGGLAGNLGDDDDDDGGGDTAGGDTAEAICGADDLEFSVHVEDAAGESGQAFTWPSTLSSHAAFVNPCAGTLSLVTPTNCLVDTWTLTGGADDVTFSGNCVDTETTWTFAEGEGTTVVADWGELGRGTYQVSATSAATGTTASEFFSVQ